MWTGLDRTERGCLGLGCVGQRRGGGGDTYSALRSICPFSDFIYFFAYLSHLIVSEKVFK